MAERHERGAVLITSTLGFADWTKIFGDANMTAALLDRLTHNTYIQMQMGKLSTKTVSEQKKDQITAVSQMVIDTEKNRLGELLVL